MSKKLKKQTSLEADAEARQSVAADVRLRLQTEIERLIDTVGAEWQYGGMGADTIYGMLAIEVALRAVIAEKMRCIAACEGERLDDPVPESDDRAYEKAIDDCIAAIRKA